MNPGEAEIKKFVEEYLGFVPEQYWPVLTFIFLSIIVILGIINPILTFTEKLIRFFDKKPTPNAPPERPDIRVLRDVWLKDRTPHSLSTTKPSYLNTKVISVVNMKGGVGKSTLTANLGAALNKLGHRVLLIDYDYQGTLSLMVSGALGLSRREIGAPSFKTLYPEVQANPLDGFFELGEPLVECGVSGASYQLFRDEMEQFARWSSGEATVDVRTQLRGYIETSVIQERFDFVLIDCGPRFTTSTINALCASTHMIVPTLLDEASTQAVTYLDKELSAHRSELFPRLEVVGIVPTLVNQDPKSVLAPSFSASEREQVEVLERTFSEFGASEPVLTAARIPRRAEISRFADRIAYYRSQEARRVFDRAAIEIEARIKT